MTGWIIIAVVFAVMVSYATMADAYDAEREQAGDPGYCRYQASPRQVIVWWWRRKLGR